MDGFNEEIQLSFLIIGASFLLMNLFAFFLMMLDKTRSGRTGAERISEGLLFFLASAFGSIGVFAGMFVFRHKTRKWYFLFGIPLLMVQNFAVLYMLYDLLRGFD